MEKIIRVPFLTFVVLLALVPLSKAQDSDVPEARPFRVCSLNTPFAVQADFEGEYRIYPNGIEVKVTKADIRVSEHCPYQGRRLLSSLRFGLATTTEDKRWKIANPGHEFPIEYVVRPGDAFSLGDLYFYIPVEDSIDLSKHWFVLQIEDTALDVAEEKRHKGYAFAHSPRDLFTLKK